MIFIKPKKSLSIIFHINDLKNDILSSWPSELESVTDKPETR